VIQELLKENGAQLAASEAISVSGAGAEAAPDTANRRSLETYVGCHRAEHFASTETIGQDSKHAYTPQPRLSLNQWALGGSWKVGEESAVLQTAPERLCFAFMPAIFTSSWEPRFPGLATIICLLVPDLVQP
jgi:hypothetical protein